MSDHVEGTVEKISAKPTRNGGTIYNIAVNTGGRDDEWFGYGFDEPNFQEGDTIGFDIVYKGDYTNVDPKSVEILEEGDGGGSNRGRGGSSRGGSSRGASPSRGSSRNSSSQRSSRGGAERGGRPQANQAAKKGNDTTMSKDDWKKKDDMIRRQACMNTAIALVRGALEAGAVALPAKKGDKFDAYIALCDEEAIRLFDQYDEQVHGGGKPAKRGGRNTQEDDEEEYDDDIPY